MTAWGWVTAIFGGIILGAVLSCVINVATSLRRIARALEGKVQP